MSNTIERVIIGNSDYTRKQMESGKSFGAWGSTLEFLELIKMVERNGYVVKFETNLFRRIFGLGIYKVVGYKIDE